LNSRTQDTLCEINAVIRDCHELFTLDCYFSVSWERFEIGGKKKDLDRIIFALRRILHFTQEYGLSDEDRQSAGLAFAKTLLARFRRTVVDEDAVGEDDCLGDQFPQLWEVRLHTNVQMVKELTTV